MSQPKVLVVEDEVPILRIIRLTLVRAGYEVATARDGKEALDVLESYEPDLILADILMPRLGGLDFLKLLRDDPRFLNTPVILLTSLNRHEDAMLGYKMGANFYLNKPFNVDTLLRTVRNALRGGWPGDKQQEGANA